MLMDQCLEIKIVIIIIYSDIYIYIAPSAKFRPSKHYNSHDKLNFYWNCLAALPYN